MKGIKSFFANNLSEIGATLFASLAATAIVGVCYQTGFNRGVRRAADEAVKMITEAIEE